ncbi:ANTAR domain-containing protein [Streptomyces sp. NPDC048508]|uniref:ANTAR domain-containing protein n=1 Tax=Streptomyces sp. NPDC048508 TaxID=3365561 RepID=UPI003714A3DC
MCDATSQLSPQTAGRVAEPENDDVVPDAAAIEERNRRLARAGVAAAQQLLVSRYRLGTSEAVFELLRDASQRFNIKLHTLADAVVRVPGPAVGAARWFPLRPRLPAPGLPGLVPSGGEGNVSHGTVLDRGLRRVLHITATEMGNVQLAEQGMLRLEKHTGLNRRFTEFFAFVGDSTTLCAQAAQTGHQSTVKDIESSDVFDDASREAILQTGSRAAHSLPITSPAGQVIGMISSHHEQPLTGFSQPRLAALETTGAVVGRWLYWHRNTIVLAALEHLHATATAA